MHQVRSTLRWRRALSLLELLVSIGVIGVLLGLLIPAVQQVRGRAVRLSCQSRLHQVALALHGYHDSHQSFPPGEAGLLANGASPMEQLLLRVSWRARLLPFVEQEGLSQQMLAALQQEKRPSMHPPHTGLVTILPVFACPADSRTSSLHPGVDGILGAHGSYLGVNSDLTYETGVLPVGIRVRMTDVTDGTSNTLMVGERPSSARLDSGWWYCNPPWFYRDGLRLGNTYASNNVLSVEALQESQWCAPANGMPAHGFGPGRIDNQCDMYHYWSLHGGGGHFAFADGSVRFLSYSIRPHLRQFATRNGGEVVPLP